jgi:hypothetical protein
MLTLSGPTVEWALAHALLLGDTDLFPWPFEYRAIKHSWDEVRDHIARQDVLE